MGRKAVDEPKKKGTEVLFVFLPKRSFQKLSTI
jgi:hypothetical protein